MRIPASNFVSNSGIRTIMQYIAEVQRWRSAANNTQRKPVVDMALQTASGILNELAKNNKITPIYSTSEEKGPPHEKTFKVALSLQGFGKYEGTGLSIKEAKNMAASIALQNCTLSGIGTINTGIQISPSVELNILAMRAREIVEYKELDPGHIRNPNPMPQYDKLLMGGPKPGHAPTVYRQFIKIWRVAVYVMSQPFIGEGKVKQEARNDAARKALIAMRDQLMLKASKNVAATKNAQDDSSENNGNIVDRNDVAKLHELAVRNQLRTSYEVITTTGPSHLLKFTVKCMVGDKETTGEGFGKKAAKKTAAKKMLQLLMNTEGIKPISDKTQNTKRLRGNKAPQRKKNQRSQESIDIFLDPVTYLTQLMQLRKEAIPVFTLINEVGTKNERKFKIQVSVGDNPELVASGTGTTKKDAKKAAADNLLKVCGIDQSKIRESENEVKKAYMSAAIGMPKSTSNPGSLMLEEKPAIQMLNRAPGGPVKTRINLQGGEMAHMTDIEKLQFLAEREGLKILFNDYGKRTESEPFTSHVALFTVPPAVFQGIGKTVEASREDAAAKALACLAHTGFSKVAAKTEKDD